MASCYRKNEMFSQLTLLTFAIISATCENITEAKDALKTEKCFAVCEKSYAVHTYPKPENLDCCKSGCRLHQLNEIENKKLTEILEACKQECDMRYGKNQGEKNACYIGCETENQIEIENSKNTIQFVSPLYSIHYVKFFTDSLHNVLKTVKMTWSYYLSSNGDILALKSSYEYDMPLDASRQKHKVEDSASDEFKNNLDLKIRLDDYKPSESSHFFGGDWLGCVARKSGLPRSFIAFSIVISIIAIVWLCLSTITSSPKKSSHVISVKGKLPAYVDINENSEKVKIQPDDEEAAPLPVKINLTSI